MEFNNRKNKIADVVTLIMPLLLILSEVLQTPSPFYAALAISILSLRHPFVIFPAYFVASLSSTYFSPVEGLGASRIFSLVLIVSLLFSKDSFKKTNGYKDIGILCVVLIVFNAFSSLISISGSFFTFFVMLQNLLVLYFLQRQNNVDIERLSLMLFWSSVIVLLGILYEVSLSGIAVDTTERYTVESTNENNFAMMCAQLGTVMVSFMFIKKELIHRLVALVLVLGCVIVIFLSGSRSSLLGLLCSAALLALISFRGNT
ncbi:MAG: hypothetical protein IKS65_04085, partial [Bacteroidales bacterium]|nr:hypothetical protein [Bacteroidales bacterium]